LDPDYSGSPATNPSRLHSNENEVERAILPSAFAEERDLFGLAPGGVCQAILIAQNTGELLPRLFTLIPPKAGRYLFCGTFLIPSLTRWNSPCYGPPCPVELGLSSPLHPTL